MSPTQRLRNALYEVADAYCDLLDEHLLGRGGQDEAATVLERKTKVPKVRRSPVRPPTLPSAPVSEMDRAAARKHLGRMGVSLKPRPPR